MDMKERAIELAEKEKTVITNELKENKIADIDINFEVDKSKSLQSRQRILSAL